MLELIEKNAEKIYFGIRKLYLVSKIMYAEYIVKTSLQERSEDGKIKGMKNSYKYVWKYLMASENMGLSTNTN